VVTSTGTTAVVTVPAVVASFPFNDPQVSQRVLIAASGAQNNTTFNRPQVGWTVGFAHALVKGLK
jgi:hypothetical protein